MSLFLLTKLAFLAKLVFVLLVFGVALGVGGIRRAVAAWRGRQDLARGVALFHHRAG